VPSTSNSIVPLVKVTSFSSASTRLCDCGMRIAWTPRCSMTVMPSPRAQRSGVNGMVVPAPACAAVDGVVTTTDAMAMAAARTIAAADRANDVYGGRRWAMVGMARD
jgi:hypothetical protein